MRHLLVASALALAAATGAHGAEGQQLSQAECDALWMQANPTNAEKISESAASAYIADVKAVNPDGDGTIEKDEFASACTQGLIKSSAATTGASEGTMGNDAAGETSDRTPEKKTETPAAQKDSHEGGTSDRTPKK
jgi:Tfp pilus assembly major pilin PilA